MDPREDSAQFRSLRGRLPRCDVSRSGQVSTVVNIPNNVSYTRGQVISILVDPADPGYAELLGSPYATDTTTAGLVISAAVFCIIGASGIVSAVRMRRRQPAWRAIQPAAPA